MASLIESFKQMNGSSLISPVISALLFTHAVGSQGGDGKVTSVNRQLNFFIINWGVKAECRGINIPCRRNFLVT